MAELFLNPTLLIFYTLFLFLCICPWWFISFLFSMDFPFNFDMISYMNNPARTLVDENDQAANAVQLNRGLVVNTATSSNLSSNSPTVLPVINVETISPARVTPLILERFRIPENNVTAQNFFRGLSYIPLSLSTSLALNYFSLLSPPFSFVLLPTLLIDGVNFVFSSPSIQVVAEGPAIGTGDIVSVTRNPNVPNEFFSAQVSERDGIHSVNFEPTSANPNASFDVTQVNSRDPQVINNADPRNFNQRFVRNMRVFTSVFNAILLPASVLSLLSYFF